jgi:adenylate cyclase
MSVLRADTSVVLLDKVADWLMQASLAGSDLETLVRGFCERLAAAGLPLARIHLTFSMLHPLYKAMGFTWRRGQGVEVEGIRHTPGGPTERFTRSPYYYLLTHQLDHLRRRINPAEPSEFPVFDDLKKIGITDYLAFLHVFDGEAKQGMMGSWSTDRSEGFSDSTIEGLLRIQNHLAVAAKMAVLGKLSGNLLTTYLGGDAGRRVLSGQIKRGDGETIRAALVMADMRQSTAYAEQHGRQVFTETLNRFFDAVATPFSRQGGQILSFLGDGFLAVYPCDRHKSQSQVACRNALSAVGQAVARMSALNSDRKSHGLSEIGYGIGLHIGNVIFGNVGLTDRLTFSAFGAAVNEVQRLEQLTKQYSSSVIASDAFVNYCGGNWKALGKEKLRGTRQEVSVFAPDLQAVDFNAEAESSAVVEDGLSDAELVVLLHRDAKRPPEQKMLQ